MTRFRLAAAALGLALVGGLVACGPGRARDRPMPGSSTRTISIDGTTRTYHLYQPANLAGPTPLVVFLHGGFGSGAQAEKSYHWDAEADSGRFLVAYPDGLQRAWNTGGGCCGSAGADDVGFLSQLVETLERELSVDPNRVYVTGISNGGMMAYTLACHTTVFAAIGPDSATQLGDCTRPAPVSVIHIHGTADRNIPYDGGPGQGVARIDGPSVPALHAAWRTIDRCAEPSVSTAGQVTTSLATCPDGRSVELITIAGAGHQWPGGAQGAADPPSQAIDATHTIWQFFSQHSK